MHAFPIISCDPAFYDQLRALLDAHRLPYDYDAERLVIDGDLLHAGLAFEKPPAGRGDVTRTLDVLSKD